MGRHAADRTAPGSPDPDRRGDAEGHRRPPHADQATPMRPGAAARAGAERAAEAFGHLVEPHRAALSAYALRLAEGDEAVADAIFEETLRRGAQEPWRFPQRTSAVRPWLMLTARKVLRDGRRRAMSAHQRRSAQGLDAWPVPATTVVEAMDYLSAVHRELIVELFYDGISLETAAASRDVPVETVKSQLFYAMRDLYAVLDQHVVDRHGVR